MLMVYGECFVVCTNLKQLYTLRTIEANCELSEF